MKPKNVSLPIAITLLGAAPLFAQKDAPSTQGARSAPEPQAVQAQLRWSDLDGDGLEDALAVSVRGDLALFLNRGDGRFDEATLAAGLADHHAVELLLCADFDGDGLSDLYLGSASGRQKLLRNLGQLTFEPIETGIDHTAPELAATALDYDRDGRIDLHVATQAGDIVYHNLGDARFERVELPLASGGLLPFQPMRGSAAPAAGETGAGKAKGMGDAELRRGGMPGGALGDRRTAGDFGEAGATPGSGGSMDLLVSCGFAAAAAGHVVDQASGTSCIAASTVPTLDMLYPISQDLFVQAGSGNVGLGTTTPSRKLTVAGNSLLDGPTTVRQGLTLENDGLAFGSWDIFHSAGQFNLNETNVATRLVMAPGGNVGIGTTTPTHRLTLGGDGQSDNLLVPGNIVLQSGGVNGGKIRFDTGGPTDWDVQGGTNWSVSRFGVDFPLLVDGASGDTNVLHDLNVTRDLFVDSSVLSVVSATDQVGINTTTPSATLDVRSSGQASLNLSGPNGTVQTLREGAAGWDIYAGTTDYAIGRSGIDFPLLISYTTGDVELRNRLGINTASPAFDLEVNGTAGKPGGGSWSVSSDARLKKNVRDVEGALETLLALRGVTFEYQDPEAIRELPGERIGFIATEVEAVLPDWVEESGGYKRLTVRGFEALAVEALRELETQNAELRARVERLEAVEAELSGIRATLAALVERR